MSLPSAGQIPPACELGRAVVDDGGRPATIVGGRDQSCLVKDKDGTTQSWIPAQRLKADPSAKASTENATRSTPTAETAVGFGGVTVFRPQVLNRLAYHADALGHIVLSARANGAPMKFLVDTGATLVSLSPDDANAAGLKHSDLTFDQIVYTGNGPVHAAITRLRELRIDDLEVEDVQVAVIDSLKQSVLGMSFLRRLKEFNIRDGVLTLIW